MDSVGAELGPVGIWTAQFDYQPAVKLRELPPRSNGSASARSGFRKVSGGNRSRMLGFF